MLGIIKKSVTAIMSIVIKINASFDKERKQLELLEKALNMLGNPGYCFIGRSFHVYGSDISDLELAFIKGKICLVELGLDPDGGNWTYEDQLSQIALHKIDTMLQVLPEFLQDYQKFLEEKEAANELILDQLTKVVEAITAIVTK